MRLKVDKNAPYKIRIDPQFQKDVRRIKKRKTPLEPLRKVIRMLAAGQTLSGKYKDHELSRGWEGFRECHIAADWLLIYLVEDEVLYLVRTGTHKELFE